MSEHVKVTRFIVSVTAMESVCNEEGRPLRETAAPQTQLAVYYPFQDPELNLRQLALGIEKERNANLDVPEEARR